MSWLPALCSAFAATAPGERGPLGDAIMAYASICTSEIAGGFFRTALQKIIEVTPASRPAPSATQILMGQVCELPDGPQGIQRTKGP